MREKQLEETVTLTDVETPVIHPQPEAAYQILQFWKESLLDNRVAQITYWKSKADFIRRGELKLEIGKQSVEKEREKICEFCLKSSLNEKGETIRFRQAPEQSNPTQHMLMFLLCKGPKLKPKKCQTQGLRLVSGPSAESNGTTNLVEINDPIERYKERHVLVEQR
ncbi:hypothetical protein AT1G29435 [Arabidopsis thaliana]|uniref:Uncharacterized protein n=1 Tax=Arabidopsis thaliana TaxID=3702 RepID=A0A1P8ATU5_ARATH|nr:uncharacterized protein AT1G29435 [Arabidopsis thaliana]ANM60037.1 hypothetical protein AT1G29435 [Arabidopsis thaliana]|eukprot:NP_001322350.1 hypothetical protein AT1G29435 [Arabidopsis thaliana]